jgi:hypothetical protein
LDLPRAEQITLLAAFSEFIRSGKYRTRRREVGAQTVLLALQAIAQTHVLAGKQSPLAGETEGKIHLVLRRQIEKYQRDDTSTKRKIALPYTAIKRLCQTRLDHNPKQQAIHDLCTIAWFYLLRVGEYTTTATTV